MKKYFQFAIYFLILMFGLFLGVVKINAEDSGKNCTTEADGTQICEDLNVKNCNSDSNCVEGYHCDSSKEQYGDKNSKGICLPNKSPSGSSAASAGPSGVSAPEENNVDQRCWTKADCEGGFGTFVGPNPETIQACKMEKDASNNLIGFCLPTAQAKMGLNWGEAGGQTSTFTHIGDFIKWIYKYGIVVAGVLAVVMIISAGFDWVMSGGSQEKITGAHKKIGNALMGLFLVLMAYSVLNLINPYLVNFRLPGIWMINKAGLVPPYCDSIKDKKFYLAKEASAEKFENTFATAMQQGFQTYDQIPPKCGWEYYVEGAGGLTCKGRVCGKGQVCLSDNTAGLETSYACKEGLLGGSVGPSKGFLCAGDLAVDVIDDNLQLVAVCKNDGDIEKVEDINVGEAQEGGKEAPFYIFPISVKSKIDSVCSGHGGLVGFYLGAEINDESGAAGIACPGMEFSTGCDDWHAIGKGSPGKCDVNLADVANKVFGKDPNACYSHPSAENCSCGSISDEDKIEKLVQDPTFVSHLITKEELLAGYQCDIDIDREDFPAISNWTIWIPTPVTTCELDDDTDCGEDQNDLWW